MNQIEDYKSYLNDNKEILSILKSNNSILYDNIKDVIAILDFNCKYFEDFKPTKDLEDFEDVFENALGYLNYQLEQIKIYFNNYFNHDLFLLKKYEPIISLIIYAEDYMLALQNEELLTNVRKKTIENLIKELDLLLLEKKNYNDSDWEKFNDTLETCVPKNKVIVTSNQLFSVMREEVDMLKDKLYVKTKH